MNLYLQDKKRTQSAVIKKKEEDIKKLKTEVPINDFFYHSINQTVEKGVNKQRFSLSRSKCKTEVG